MTLRALSLALALAASAVAQSSPASELFERGVTLTERYYHGVSQADPSDLARQPRAELARLCAGQAACSLANGQQELERYLSAFHDGHLFLLSPQSYAAVKARYTASLPAEPTYGLVLDTRGAGGTLIRDVVVGSPAERAGLAPGDRLVGVDGGPVPTAAELNRRPTLSLTVARGPVGTASTREVQLSRATLAPLLLPELYAPADAPPGVMVLRIPNFQYAGQVGPRVHALVHQAQRQGARGIILDLRGGHGGSNYECEMAAGAFTGPYRYSVEARQASYPAGWTGTRSLDDADLAFSGVVAPWAASQLAYDVPDPARWTGPVAVLVDAETASCHEYAAYFLQQLVHAPVIGVPTAGLLNTADLALDLPDGGALFMPAFRSLDAAGRPFPERVTPDLRVPPDPQGFADSGRDPMLEAAYRALGLAPHG